MNALTKISNFFMTPAMKIVMIVAALLFPFVAGNEYQIYVMALAFVWAIAVYGMNIITGLCGQFHFCRRLNVCRRSDPVPLKSTKTILVHSMGTIKFIY